MMLLYIASYFLIYTRGSKNYMQTFGSCLVNGMRRRKENIKTVKVIKP